MKVYISSAERMHCLTIVVDNGLSKLLLFLKQLDGIFRESLPSQDVEYVFTFKSDFVELHFIFRQFGYAISIKNKKSTDYCYDNFFLHSGGLVTFQNLFTAL